MVKLMTLLHFEPSETIQENDNSFNLCYNDSEINSTSFYVLLDSFLSKRCALFECSVFYSISFYSLSTKWNSKQEPWTQIGSCIQVTIHSFSVYSYHFVFGFTLHICTLFHLSTSFPIFLQKWSTNPDTNRISVSFIQIVHVLFFFLFFYLFTVALSSVKNLLKQLVIKSVCVKYRLKEKIAQQSFKKQASMAKQVWFYANQEPAACIKFEFIYNSQVSVVVSHIQNRQTFYSKAFAKY